MITCNLNIISICNECHTKIHGKNGRELDLQLKQELQLQLTLLFTKEYYQEEEIRQLLGINKKQVARLVKTIVRQKEGYLNTLIVKRCLGDRFYS